MPRSGYFTAKISKNTATRLPDVDTSSERSDAAVLGGGVELICILERELRAASAAADAGGFLAAIDSAYRLSARKRHSYIPDTVCRVI